MRDEILWRTLYDNHCAELYDIAAVIKDEGAGAIEYWSEMATSASAGNEAAKAKIEELLGKPVENLNDIYQVTRICSALSSLSELKADAHKMSSMVGANASSIADHYLVNHIAEKRKEKGLTQIELAKISGVPVYTLQKLEHYPDRVLNSQYNTIRKLAKALDTTMEQLIEVND